MRERPYHALSDYLRERCGGKTAKICLDGGFTCPHRENGGEGCLFCSARGAGEFAALPATPIEEQVKARLASPLGGRRADRFIAYFQNFTGTYAPLRVLQRTYRAALCDSRIVGLAVATRPDCVSPAVADLLADFARTHYVSVELGLQTASSVTAERVNLACKRTAFTAATHLLAERGIDTVAHMMVGLPGEGRYEALATLRFINRHPVKGLKIHSLYLTRGTGLSRMWERGNYTPLTFAAYTETVALLLSHARPDLIIHRLTGDPPKEDLLAPAWATEKNRVLDEIHRLMWEQSLTQGCLYTPN